MASVKRQCHSNRPFDRILEPLNTIHVVIRRQTAVLALFLCLVWMPAYSAWASDVSDLAGASTDTVVFAIPDVWPWAYEDSDGRPQGSLVAVARRLAELTGVPVEPRLRPLRRAIIELDSGEVNFSLLFQSPALDNRAINVAEVVQIDIMLAALAGSDHPLSLEELAGKRIGYIRGTYLGEAFENNTEVQKVPVAVISQGIEMLSLGRLSAVLASDHAIVRTLQTMGLGTDALRFSKHIKAQPGALYMSRRAQRPQVAEKFRKAVSQMVESDELNQIFFGDAGRPTQDDAGRPASYSAQ